jgi:hypothetical protein
MNREKLGWVVAAVVVLTTCTLGAMQQQDQQGQVGRYKLVECQTEIVGDGAVAKKVAVFRIDTATGATVEYVALAGKDGGSGWMPINNFKNFR